MQLFNSDRSREAIYFDGDPLQYCICVKSALRRCDFPIVDLTSK